VRTVGHGLECYSARHERVITVEFRFSDSLSFSTRRRTRDQWHHV